MTPEERINYLRSKHWTELTIREQEEVQAETDASVAYWFSGFYAVLIVVVGILLAWNDYIKPFILGE